MTSSSTRRGIDESTGDASMGGHSWEMGHVTEGDIRRAARRSRTVHNGGREHAYPAE
jgi:hypothetical protein